MSFFLTTPQFLAGTKDVTRRTGWKDLKPGTRLQAVRKTQGLKRGEHPVRLGEIEVISVRREALWAITEDECRREGFPSLTPDGFVSMFCGAMGCQPEDVVTRIEFRRI